MHKQPSAEDNYIWELEGRITQLETELADTLRMVDELSEELQQYANHNLMHFWYEKCQKAERELRAYRGMPKPTEAPY